MYSSLPDGDRPRAVKLGRPAIDLAAGYTHTCALLEDKSVRCWGDNRRKQLGVTTRVTKSLSPKPVVGLGGPVTMIAAGEYWTCALLENSTVKCWGDGRSKPVTVRRKRGTLTGAKTDSLTGVAWIGMSRSGALVVRDTRSNILCDTSKICGNVPGATSSKKEDGESSVPFVFRSALRGSPLGSASCIVFSVGLGCGPQALPESLESLRSTQGPAVAGCWVVDPEYLGPPPILLEPGKFSSSCDDPSLDYETNKSRFAAFADPKAAADARRVQIEQWVADQKFPSFRSPFADVVTDVRDGSGSEISGCVVTGDALQLRCWGPRLQKGRASTKTFEFVHPEMADVRDVAVGVDRACVVRGGGTPGSSTGNTLECWGWNEYGQSGSSKSDVLTTPTQVVFAG